MLLKKKKKEITIQSLTEFYNSRDEVKSIIKEMKKWTQYLRVNNFNNTNRDYFLWVIEKMWKCVNQLEKYAIAEDAFIDEKLNIKEENKG